MVGVMCQSLEADIQMGVLGIEKLTFLQYGQYDKNATIMEGRGILLLFWEGGGGKSTQIMSSNISL